MVNSSTFKQLILCRYQNVHKAIETGFDIVFFLFDMTFRKPEEISTVFHFKEKRAKKGTARVIGSYLC